MLTLIRTPKLLGTYIRERRKELGLSQSDLAEKCGTRQASISLLETGNPGIKLENLLLVLSVLQLDLAIQNRKQSSHSEIEDLF
ncbi:antitoxin HipB [Pseudovibrio sp. Ad13]|uniref:helix-turn-helix domain-containing protein n=1 Tax=unclassified Pseudovibrio TaxID=2627060 RepID=UPI000710ED63|nr:MULTISPECIES: helix-turn-helix domain-containing protein [unclassified Pseudovibrio]KZK84950.1 antitoxin HipB [Pseudovibrio sp. Ad13]